MRKRLLIADVALTLALSLTACGGEIVTKTTDFLNQNGQASASGSEVPASERTVTSTMLLDGKETNAYIFQSSVLQIKQEGTAPQRRCAFLTNIF